MNYGIVAALSAFTLWGFLPVYWKLLAAVPAAEILSHRMVWSLLFVLLLLSWRRHWQWLRPALANPKVLINSSCCALLLAVNWLTYIWAVNSGHILETSLGYYINPLVNVLLGVVVMKERLRPLQWLAIGLAAGGVLYLTFGYGQLPWIALTLAFTFGFYGLLRKRASLPSLEGLTLETAVLFLPALGFLIWCAAEGSGSFAQQDYPQGLSQDLLLAGTGIATALPLLWFAYAAQRVSLSTLGVMQYIGPTIQLVLGIWIYGEAFDQQRLTGFLFIWAAVILYTLEGLWRHKQSRRLATG